MFCRYVQMFSMATVPILETSVKLITSLGGYLDKVPNFSLSHPPRRAHGWTAQ